MVIGYLTLLLGEWLTYASLKVHLAAIVAYTRGYIERHLFTAPIIKRFLEGAKRIAQSMSAPTPTWNLPVVLTQLMKKEFEPIYKATLKFITIKPAFLTAMTSLRSVSEL